MKRVILLIGLTIFLSAEFSRSVGVIRDTVSGLTWQDDYGSSENIKKTTWSEALIYCDELVLGEQSDWRLPNQNELKTIVDRNRENPAISTIFQNVSSSYYWSSTTVVSDSSSAWFVYFGSGSGYWHSKLDEHYVRCVRGIE